MEAMRCACQWVIFGPERACSEYPGLLADPEQDLSATPHFGVEDRLARLPSGWLHVGCLIEVPPGACYKAHCGGTWVWVMPEGRRGLADFTLVLHDIATLDLRSIYATPILVTLTKWVPTGIVDPTTGKSEYLVPCQETRAIKPEYKQLIDSKIQKAITTQNGTVAITWADWVKYSVPYRGMRTNITPQGEMVPATPVSQGRAWKIFEFRQGEVVKQKQGEVVKQKPETNLRVFP
jgi:hypothetical protein